MADGGIIEMMAENVDINVDYPLPVDGRKFVKIAIKDNGIGIPEKHLAKIFDPYFTTKQKGHGLGLSTCYFIIQKHDGYITVDSEPGVGTTFSIYLPASPKQVLKKKDLKKSIMAGQGKILVMDDEEFIRTMVCRMLTQLGYKAEAAKDGAEAIAIYKHARRLNQGFNAVIMDLTIAGGMGGREAIKKLLEVDPNAKVIVSSGYSNDPVMANYKKYGFCGIIPKPYNIENLYKILSETITNSA
jgi:CheY-like chemotaxis protein